MGPTPLENATANNGLMDRRRLSLVIQIHCPFFAQTAMLSRSKSDFSRVPLTWCERLDYGLGLRNSEVHVLIGLTRRVLVLRYVYSGGIFVEVLLRLKFV